MEGGRDWSSRAGWVAALAPVTQDTIWICPQNRENGGSPGRAPLSPWSHHGARDLPNMAPPCAAPRPAPPIGRRRPAERSDWWRGEGGAGVWRKWPRAGGDVESGHGRRGRAGPGAPRRHRAGAASGGAAAAGEGARGAGGGPGGPAGRCRGDRASVSVGTGPRRGDRSAVTVGTDPQRGRDRSHRGSRPSVPQGGAHHGSGGLKPPAKEPGPRYRARPPFCSSRRSPHRARPPWSPP